MDSDKASVNKAIYDDLVFLFGEIEAGPTSERLKRLLYQFRRRYPQLSSQPPAGRFDERDSILITYGDMVQAEGAAPLHTLAHFLDRQLEGVVRGVHILPFYPYSSDDGFSVIDYLAVDPALGDWNDVARVGRHFRLMFDAVINHISAGSTWFQGFLANDNRYRDYFIVVEPGADLSLVFRPRALPLLTPVQQSAGEGATVERLVWTTFSTDQIDLNFANPDVLLEIIQALLFYCAQGCRFIRLDAIAYMWKEAGTSSIHLPQTHRIIQLIRRVLDHAAPKVALITETNVPHEDNVSYFGDGRNEAQMVYNFTLPPLTLHAFHTGNAEALSRWASTLTLPSDEVTFFNFLASHDGIGLMPLMGILDDQALENLAQRVRDLGGYVSERARPDGSTSPYELNINYLDALGDPHAAEECDEMVARRFLAAQAIMLALRGVPGIYFHSLFGSRGWAEGAKQTGRARTINRQKLQRDDLEAELVDPASLRGRIFNGCCHLLRQRRSLPAFHPNGAQMILDLHEALFCLLRESPDGQAQVLCLHNVSDQQLALTADLAALSLPGSALLDLVSGAHHQLEDGALILDIDPYQVMWLKFR